MNSMNSILNFDGDHINQLKSKQFSSILNLDQQKNQISTQNYQLNVYNVTQIDVKDQSPYIFKNKNSYNEQKVNNAKIKSKKQKVKRSIGRNSHQHFGKACRAYIKKLKLSKSSINKKVFIEKNFIISMSSRTNIISYFVFLYYYCKNQLKQQKCQKTLQFISYMKKKLQNYNNKKASSNSKIQVKENIQAKKKIISFLDELLKDIKLLEQLDQIQEKLIWTCFRTEYGKENDKNKIREQMQLLYKKVAQQKNYSGLFQLQKKYIKKSNLSIDDTFQVKSQQFSINMEPNI